MKLKLIICLSEYSIIHIVKFLIKHIISKKLIIYNNS